MINGIRVSAIILGGGLSSRMGRDKLALRIKGESVLIHTVKKFCAHKYIDEVIAVLNKDKKEDAEKAFKNAGLLNIKTVCGGKTRAESSLAGIKAAAGEYVLIHDGARPFVSEDIITSVTEGILNFGAAAAALPVTDTIKEKTDSGYIKTTLERERLCAMQTPQGFKREDILRAYSVCDMKETDDCAAAQKAHIAVRLVAGSPQNIKLTTPGDILHAKAISKEETKMRIGTGFDSHRLETGRELVIGGVKIPYEKGLLGHSDADVLLHAVIDALFGAAALGDIGTHFPDSDERYRGASSVLLLKKCGEAVKNEGYGINNIDTTIIAQAPKLAPYIEKMRDVIANTLDIPRGRVSVKAKTNEHMGFTGRGEGIEARAAVLIE